MKTYTYGDEKNTDIFNEPVRVIIPKNGHVKSNYSDTYLKEIEEYEKNNLILENLNINLGTSVTGTIYEINKDEVILDLGAKEFAYISIEKDKLDLSELSIGQEIEFLVNSNKGVIRGSISDNAKSKVYKELKDPENSNIYKARVLELSDNGYILDIKGVKVFMPGSLAGVNKLTNFNELLGKEINVMSVPNQNTYSKYADRIIVSHREYLKTLIPEELDKLTIGAVYTGKVTDTTKFGIFVEFNSVLTGLIHKDEFDEMLKTLFEQGNVKPGVEIDFYLKEIVNKNRIILTRMVDRINTKQKKSNFKKGQEVEGTVIKSVNYGVFIQLDNETSGLIHTDNLNNTLLNKGDKVKVKIISNKENKFNLELV
jgi:ribosomal protein S1